MRGRITRNLKAQKTSAMRRGRTPLLAVALAAALALGLAAGEARGATQTLFEDDFEGAIRWDLSGDWRFKSNSGCLPDDPGYNTPLTALAFDFGTDCAYRDDRAGYATMLYDVYLPITTPTVRLEWWDFVGAETGADFYFIELSTDGGVTWPHEVYRESKDELFWDQESIDLSAFVDRTIRLRFGFSSDSTVTNYGWYVDDVHIVGDELPVGVSALALRDVSMVEGDTETVSMNFVLEIAPANEEDITLEYATADGTARSSVDFLATSRSQVVTAGSTSITIPVEVIGDSFFEDDETFLVTIRNASNNSRIVLGSAVGTIVDDEVVTHLFTEEFEPQIGSLPWSVNFEQSRADAALWHLADSSACLPGRNVFISPTHSMVFNDEATCTYHTPGGIEGIVQLTAPRDIPFDAVSAQLSFWDYLEVFYDGAQSAKTTAYVEARRFGSLGAWTTLLATFPEEPSLVNQVFPWTEHVLSLDAFIGESVEVRFRFVQPAGEPAPVTPPAGWYVDQFKISYGAPSPYAHRVVVGDAIAPLAEGSQGTTELVFPIAISPPTAPDAPPAPVGGLTIAYETRQLAVGDAVSIPKHSGPITANDIALADEDYMSTSSYLVIPAGATVASISILVSGEDMPEEDEYFQLLLSNVSPIVHLVNTAVLGTIEDDDDASDLTVTRLGDSSTPIVLPEEVGVATFKITVSPVRSVPITVHYRTVDGTALSGGALDFIAAEGSVTIPPLASSRTFDVIIVDDPAHENVGWDPTTPPVYDEALRVKESFTIEVTTESPYADGSSVDIFILDNDDPAPERAALSLSTEIELRTSEASPGGVSSGEPCATCDPITQAVVTLTLTLTEPFPNDVEIEYETRGGTDGGRAEGGTDYIESSGIISFNSSASPAETVKTIEIEILPDRIVEGNETFEVVLSNPTFNLIPISSTAVVTIIDDDYERVAFGVDGITPSNEVVRTSLIAGQPDPDPLPLLDFPNLTAAEFRSFDYDRLYGWDVAAGKFVTMDLVSGIVGTADSVPAGGGQWTGLAWDHTNGKAYGVSDAGTLYEVDLTTGIGVQQGGIGIYSIASIAVHPTTGRIYGVEVNRSTNLAYLHTTVPGEWAFGPGTELIGFAAGDDPAMDAYWDSDFDDTTGELYISAHLTGGDFELRKVDLNALSVAATLAAPAAGDPSRTVSSLAVATPPTSPGIQWSGDVGFADTAPQGIHIIGDTASDAALSTGLSVSGVGDVNGDGFADFLVAAKDSDEPGALAVGRVYLFYGGAAEDTAARLMDLAGGDVTLAAELFDGLNDDDLGAVEFVGHVEDLHLGSSVAGVGDVNGDFLGDFLLGFTDVGDGDGAYLIFGNRAFSASISSAEIGGAAVPGVRIMGDLSLESSGLSLSGAGDFNADGLNDLILGAAAGPGLTGAAYVVFGSDAGMGGGGELNLEALVPPAGIRILGQNINDGFGTSVSGAGDINGDGIDDILIGIPEAAPGGGAARGQALVVFGHMDYGDHDAPNPLDLARLNGTPTLSITRTTPPWNELADYVFPEQGAGKLPGALITGELGEEAKAARFGASVAGAGDLNGDGIDDLLIGAPAYDAIANGADEEHGSAYVVYGKDTLGPDSDVDTATWVDIAAIRAGTLSGLTLTGIDAGDGTGAAVTGAGDLNGDGYMDAVLGAAGATPGGFSGEAYLFYGGEANSERKGLKSLRDLVAEGIGVVLHNTLDGDGFGVSLSSAGDVNGDGISDLVIGRKGGAYLVLGEAVEEVATYETYMPSGMDPAFADFDPDLLGPGLTGTTVFGGVGLTDDGSYARPVSGVGIEFDGGGAGGAELLGPSVQTVVLDRNASARREWNQEGVDWVLAGSGWDLTTTREAFASSTLEFHYRPSDAAGLNMQKVGVFYAKHGTDLNDMLNWSSLSFTHDPDRNVFTVKRSHPTSATAQREFNGHYALIQADSTTVLGDAIKPPPGLDPEHLQQPHLGPLEGDSLEDFAYWHAESKRLYATKAGDFSITWKYLELGSSTLVEVKVRALNIWPDNASPRWQTYIAGSDSVVFGTAGDPNGDSPFGYGKLADKADDANLTVYETGVDPITLDDTQDPVGETEELLNFSTSGASEGRCMVMLATGFNLGSPGDLYFQFVRVVQWDSAEYLVGGANGFDWEIGEQINAVTDPNGYGAHHDETAGGPLVHSENAHYLRREVTAGGNGGDIVRYEGFYNRKERTGTIVPVNVEDSDPFVLVFYEMGSRLVNAETSQPEVNQPALAWPHKTAKYNTAWPADASKIIIARQDGTGELDLTVYGEELDVYVQNDPNLPGYNPNEEHAMLAPYGAGQALFALRTDFNGAESEPHALLTYYDPLDDGAAKVKVWSVVPEDEGYVFEDWGNFEGDSDPYETEAGAFLLPPYPLSVFEYRKENKGSSTVTYIDPATSAPADAQALLEDSTGHHWAKAGGFTISGALPAPLTLSGTEVYDPAYIEMTYYYPAQEGFVDRDGDGNLTDGKLAGRADDPDPDDSSNPGIKPIQFANPVTYTVYWPSDVARMQVGDVLVDPKYGLPQIDGQCSVDIAYQTSKAAGDAVANDMIEPLHSAILIDPVQTRSVDLEELPTDLKTDRRGAEIIFTDLPPALQFRISYSPMSKKLKVKGILVEPGLGFPYVLLNVLSVADRETLLNLPGAAGDTNWQGTNGAVQKLWEKANEPIELCSGAGCDPPAEGDPYWTQRPGYTEDDYLDDHTEFPDVMALSTGSSQGVGYVTLVMQDNAESCLTLPVSLEIIRVMPELETGNVAVVMPPCVFEEKLTLQHTNDFGGHPEDYEFQWLYYPDEDGTIPPMPGADSPTSSNDPWQAPPTGDPTNGVGIPSIAIEGPGLLTLTDNWFSVRYKYVGPNGSNPENVPWKEQWSDWTSPQFAPGWIKRVIGEINPFTQRASGGGIAGAEASFASFQDGAVNTLLSMVAQAGARFSGSVALSCENLDDLGLLEIYETVLYRGMALSVDAASPVDHPLVNKALLLVASRVNDLYMLLGNEAYMDAMDPTIPFETRDNRLYEEMATSIHSFMNQTSSLLEEELSLLRGRDATYSPGVREYPVYNRLVWNFTLDLTGGEVAYALTYNIRDNEDDGDFGAITELDAKRAYPQGHGDAWGHYLRAIKTYYKLLNHPFYTWGTRSEGFLVAGKAVTVDYLDERKFAAAAAAKARTGVSVVDLTYREQYVEGSDVYLLGYTDSDEDRAWGFDEWVGRASVGTYLDWVVGASLLRAEDPDADHTGVTKIDRTTVPELSEIPALYRDIEAKADMANLGMNPLGLSNDVIPFDISPDDIDGGKTHFEQIYARAVNSLKSTLTVLDHANVATLGLRREAQTQISFERSVLSREVDYNNRLIEIYGYPYEEDIGGAGLYDAGYDGPDLYHYMYNEPSYNFDTGNDDDYGDPAENFRVTVTLKDLRMVAGFAIRGTAGTIEVPYNLHLEGGRLGFAKEAGWTQRRAPGQIQVVRAKFKDQLSRLDSAIREYEKLLADIADQNELMIARYAIQATIVYLEETKNITKLTVDELIIASKSLVIALKRAEWLLDKGVATVKDFVPDTNGAIAGLAMGLITSIPSAIAEGSASSAGLIARGNFMIAADINEVIQMHLKTGLDTILDHYNLAIKILNYGLADGAEIVKLESAIRKEVIQRQSVYRQFEAVMQAAGAYDQVLAKGDRLLAQRERFRKQMSGDTQRARYRDMAFRIFRNEALQKYRAQFDVAARYTYLAAKAYDYETTLLSSDPLAGQQVLTDIVQARQLGTVTGGAPIAGTGLADPLAKMSANFAVLSGQLGFNNPQQETNRFSIRSEMLGVLPPQSEGGGVALADDDPLWDDGDDEWKAYLSQDYAVHGLGTAANLWNVAEFRQYAVPPEGFGDVEPGIVIPFSTMVTEGFNFFGNPLGSHESTYDSTNFATKIRSVGVWFGNYDSLGLSSTPRVYLIPVGIDSMRSPTSFTGRIRQFIVVDQRIPIPFPIGYNELDDPNWIPALDNPGGRFDVMRRHGRFRAYHDSGRIVDNEPDRYSRLIGRSVWNSKWMLIIPASTLHSDRELALDRFINGTANTTGVTDIKIFFETYAYPRLKKLSEEQTTIIKSK